MRASVRISAFFPRSFAFESRHFIACASVDADFDALETSSAPNALNVNNSLATDIHGSKTKTAGSWQSPQLGSSLITIMPEFHSSFGYWLVVFGVKIRHGKQSTLIT